MPQQITKTRAILNPEMALVLKDISDTFYQELDEEFDSFKNHVLISQFDFDDDWPTWEMHPKGDELVLLLSGSTDMVLAHDEGEEVIKVSKPGEYVVVPRGVWHTARPHQPTSMLFITPGEGTLNEEKPPRP